MCPPDSYHVELCNFIIDYTKYTDTHCSSLSFYYSVIISVFHCWSNPHTLGTMSAIASYGYIYTTKIDGVVCPPNISETVENYCPFYQFYLKYFQRIVADPKRKLSPPFHSADSVPNLGHPAPGCRYLLRFANTQCG